MRHHAGANDRERGLMQATRRFLDGDWDDGCRQLDRVLVDHPRDALALQAAHLMDFYRGDALQPAQPRVARAAALGRVGARATPTCSACTRSGSRR